MVNVLVSGSSGPSSSPGREYLFFSWEGHFTLTLYSSQVYKWVPANLILGLTPPSFPK